MKFGLKSLFWSAGSLLLLLSVLLLPALNVLTVTLMMVPYVILYTMLPTKSFAIQAAVVLAIAFLIAGPVAPVVGLFFLVPAVIMGHLYRKKTAARVVLTAAILTILGELMLELVLFEVILDLSLIQEMSNLVRSMTDDLLAQGMMPPQWNEEMTEAMIRVMIHSLPLVFISIAFFYSVLTHFIARRILRAYGIDVPGMPPAHEWMVPRSLVFYYLVAIVLEMFISPQDTSFISVALLNLVPLLRFVFAIQTIGFFFFIAHQRRWSRAVPLLMSIPVLLFPPLSLIGVLDVAFPIRKSFTKS
ncbi:hypothetical protein IJ21_03950 [Paenibacillus sp. 32O-W]|nr:hypothetical protein IJ21_03950 [Paenibacillus sp. 32O-W]